MATASSTHREIHFRWRHLRLCPPFIQSMVSMNQSINTVVRKLWLNKASFNCHRVNFLFGSIFTSVSFSLFFFIFIVCSLSAVRLNLVMAPQRVTDSFRLTSSDGDLLHVCVVVWFIVHLFISYQLVWFSASVLKSDLSSVPHSRKSSVLRLFSHCSHSWWILDTQSSDVTQSS